MSFKKKICVCFFGVIGRSIRFTHEYHIERMIKPLKQLYDVDIYVFNLDVGDTKVDGRSINARDYNIIDATYYEEYNQNDLDNEIEVYYKKGICKMRPNYTEILIRNSLRQMYSECRVGCFLDKNRHKYSSAVVCGPDYCLLKPINIDDIKLSFSETDVVYTTDVNNGNGYTNGFYIGHLSPLINVLKRYEIIEQLLPTRRDYEYLLKKTFNIYGINRKLTNMLFVKIRNNGRIQRQGKMLNKENQYYINKLNIKGNIIF